MTETTRTIHEVMDRYNQAFHLHDPTLLVDLISDDCVIEDTSPAPAGARHEGGRACLARWSALAGSADLRFSPERAEILGDLAVAVDPALGNGRERLGPGREPDPRPGRQDRRGARLREGLRKPAVKRDPTLPHPHTRDRSVSETPERL